MVFLFFFHVLFHVDTLRLKNAKGNCWVILYKDEKRKEKVSDMYKDLLIYSLNQGNVPCNVFYIENIDMTMLIWILDTNIEILCYLNEILLTIENNECNAKWYIPSYTIPLPIMDKVFYFNDLLQPWENVTKLYLLTIWVLNYTTDCTFARAKLKKYDRMRAGKNGFHLYAKILS